MKTGKFFIVILLLLVAVGISFSQPAVEPGARVSFSQIETFDMGRLVRIGDELKYGSYIIRKIGQDVYQINDPGDIYAGGGGVGVDFYIVNGSHTSLVIDLGNDYINGRPSNNIQPRPNAAEEFLSLIHIIAGSRRIEVGITHLHADHFGIIGALEGTGIPVWVGHGEVLTASHGANADMNMFQIFNQGEKVFDLGGGVIIETFLVRGHTLGGTVFIDKHHNMIFTGDALGSGCGQSFNDIGRLNLFAIDMQRLVDYIMINFLPYERYTLQVQVGNSWQTAWGGSPDSFLPLIDLAFLDWCFIQDLATGSRLMFEGVWLDQRSMLHHLGTSYVSWPGMDIFMYGTATFVMPMEVARMAALLP